jgi:hypothetical protein
VAADEVVARRREILVVAGTGDERKSRSLNPGLAALTRIPAE